VEGDTAVLVRQTSEGTGADVDEGVLHGSLLGLLQGHGGDTLGIEQRAQAMLDVALSLKQGSVPSRPAPQQVSPRVRVVPVIHVVRKTYGATAGELQGDTCAGRNLIDAGETLDHYLDRLSDVVQSKDPDLSVREKVHQLSERFARLSQGLGPEPGPKARLVTFALDADGIEACAVRSHRRPLRVCGPTVLDGHRLHAGDEVNMTGLLLLRDMSDMHNAATRVEVFDALAYKDHVRSLRAGDAVSVMLDVPAFDARTMRHVASVRGKLAAVGAALVVRQLVPSVIVPTVGVTACTELRLDGRAPWQSGAFVYGAEYKGHRFCKSGVALGGVAVMVSLPPDPRQDPELMEMILPAVPSLLSGLDHDGWVSELDLRAASGMPGGVVTDMHHGDIKRIVEFAVTRVQGAQTEPASRHEHGDEHGDSPVARPGVRTIRRPEFARLRHFVGTVRDRNAGDEQYLKANAAALKVLHDKLKASIARGGGVQRAAGASDCAERVPRSGPLRGQGQWLLASFDHPTGHGDSAFLTAWDSLPHGNLKKSEKPDVQDRIDKLLAEWSRKLPELPAVVSMSQGHVTLADLVGARANSAWGPAVPYDHIRAVDVPCITTLARQVQQDLSRDAEQALRAAVTFSSPDHVLSSLERKVALWADGPVQDTSPSKTFTYATADPRDQDLYEDQENDQDLVLTIADLSHYRSLQADPTPGSKQLPPPEAEEPAALLDELLDAVGLELDAAETALVMSNVDFYAPMDAALKRLDRQVLELKKRRAELQERSKLKGDAYAAFERSLVQRLRQRILGAAQHDQVVVMCAMLALIVERHPGRLEPSSAKFSCPGPGSRQLALSHILACAAREVLLQHQPASDQQQQQQERQGTGRRNKKTASVNVNVPALAELERLVTDRRAQVSKDKPGPVPLGKPGPVPLGSQSASGDPSWRHFRPLMHAAHEAQAGAAKHHTRATALIAALQQHMHAQQSLIIGFNNQRLRHVNACCMDPIGVSGESLWKSLARASGDVMRAHAALAQPDTKWSQVTARVVNGVPPGSAMTARVPSGNDRGVPLPDWHVSSGDVKVPSPLEIPALPRQAQSPDRPSLKELVAAVVASVRDDRLAAVAVELDKPAQQQAAWARFEQGVVDSFRKLAGTVELDKALTVNLEEAVVRQQHSSTDLLHDVHAVSLNFLAADLGPAFKALEAGPTNHLDAGLREALARIASHEPAAEAAALRQAAGKIRPDVTPAARKLLAAFPDLRAATSLAVHLGVDAMAQLVDAAPPRLTGSVSAFVSLLLMRLQSKVAFNRRDRTADDVDRAMEQARTAENLRRIRIRDQLSDDDKAFLREYQKIGRKVDWDAVESEFAGQANPKASSIRSRTRGPEDARGLYWSDD
jgi:hypothetical protein